MYRLLLITQATEATDPALLKAQNFEPVETCPDIATAMKMIAMQTYNAIGVFDKETLDDLAAHLKALGDGTPAFMMPYEQDEQAAVLRDVRHLLHRLYLDYIDEDYPLRDLSLLIQYEMMHNLLSGKSTDAAKLQRWFNMLRSDIPLELPCRVYSMVLPEGDLYLVDHWHHGQQRLQKSLERNFFNHIEQIAYCAVSFIDPTEARLLLIPEEGSDIDQITDALDAEVLRCIDEIKSYLDLDIDVYQAGTAACIADIPMMYNTKEA